MIGMLWCGTAELQYVQNAEGGASDIVGKYRYYIEDCQVDGGKFRYEPWL